MKAGSSIRIYIEVELTSSVSSEILRTVTNAAVSVARTEMAALPAEEVKYGFRARPARASRIRRRKYCNFPFPLTDLAKMRKHCTLPQGHEGPHRARDGSELITGDMLRPQ